MVVPKLTDNLDCRFHIDNSSSKRSQSSPSKSPLTPTLARERRRNQPFMDVIKHTLRQGCSNWPRIDTTALESRFVMRMNSDCLIYSTEPTTTEHFKEAMMYMDEIESMRRSEPEIVAESMAESIQQDMVLAMFGSNAIERVGENLDETRRLCEMIFRGEEANGVDRIPEYKQTQEEEQIVRKRNEVVQHAHALRYITTAVVVEHQPFSEYLVTETHRILLTGVNHERYGTKWEEYAGLYRNKVKQPGTNTMGAEVHAGDTCFTPSKRVPDTMKRIIADLNADITTAENIGLLDPYCLAAKYCAEFVWCHPFLDGNGRACRLLLNAILLKYAGIVVPIGEHEEERQEYLDIKRRYTRECTG